jgi:peroxygenase
LARHAAFFDGSGDGHVRLGETYGGLRALGVGLVLSVVLAPVINVALGKRTGGSLFTIEIGGILKGRHAFDTGTFDPAGQIDEAHFARLFERAAGGRAAITKDEFITFVRSNPDAKTPDVPAFLLKFFAWAEASVFFGVAGTGEGGDRVVPRARLHRFYEGRLLFAIARRVRLERALGAPVTKALGKNAAARR